MVHPNIRAGRRIGREIRAAAAKAARAALSEEQIDKLLTQAIIDRAFAAGGATEADLARLNVPAAKVTPQRIRRCLALARERCPRLDATYNPAA